MSSKSPDTQVSIDRRTKRARFEAMEIVLARPATAERDGKVNVTNVSKSEPSTYTITVDDTADVVDCTCPDWTRREPDGGCKHMRRVESEDAVLVAVTGNVTAGTGTNADCDECDSLPGEWPCATCYVSGRRALPGDK